MDTKEIMETAKEVCFGVAKKLMWKPLLCFSRNGKSLVYILTFLLDKTIYGTGWLSGTVLGQ